MIWMLKFIYVNILPTILLGIWGLIKFVWLTFQETRNVVSLEADLRMKWPRLICVWAKVYLRWSLFGIWQRIGIAYIGSRWKSCSNIIIKSYLIKYQNIPNQGYLDQIEIYDQGRQLDRAFVFPGPWSWPWPLAPIRFWRPGPNLHLPAPAN